MKNLKTISLAALALLFVFGLSSCRKEGCTDPEATNYNSKAKKDDGSCVYDEEDHGGQTLSGEQTGCLEKGTYIVTGDIIVPEGETLCLKPGVILAFDGDGMTPETSPELRVHGELIADGTASDPIYLTVVEDRRDPSNAFEGLWGGIQASPSATAVVLRHVTVEYTGGPASQSDLYDAGDPRYAIAFNNPQGVLIFDHSTLRHIADDGIRPQGGARIAITHSVFYNVGETGGEGINTKDGTVGDVCYNLFYGLATNGSKHSGEGDGVPQTNVHTYNNTFVNCGFRRVQAGRGGSTNYEGGAKGDIWNNIVVNCRFGTRFRGDKLPDIDNINYGYHVYYAYDATDEDNFFPSTDIDENGDRLTSPQDGDQIQVDPMFVNYNVSTDKMKAYPVNPDDFRLQSGSPALGAGKTDFSPVHASLSAGGVTVNIPAPSDFIGAYGN